jgi:hypothetical protein
MHTNYVNLSTLIALFSIFLSFFLSHFFDFINMLAYVINVFIIMCGIIFHNNDNFPLLNDDI